jgi:lipopolysaccharide export LptBFGC system permease protein LptF
MMAILFLILAIILFFRFHMYRVFDKLSGHAERKARDKFVKKVHETPVVQQEYDSGDLDEDRTGLLESHGQAKTGEISNISFKEEANGHNNAFDILDQIEKDNKVYDETGLLNLNQDDDVTGLLRNSDDETLTGVLNPKSVKEKEKEGDYPKQKFTITSKVLISHEDKS